MSMPVANVATMAMVGVLMAHETPNRTASVHAVPFGGPVALRSSHVVVRRSALADGLEVRVARLDHPADRGANARKRKRFRTRYARSRRPCRCWGEVAS